MKCIMSKSGKTVERVDNKLAVSKVATGKWAYTSKEIWKQVVRDVNAPVSEVEKTEDSDEKTHGLKAKDRKKLNKKK